MQLSPDALYQATLARDARFDGADPAAVVARLSALPGIGDWTAQYIAMRALGWPDAFPSTDLHVRMALGDLRPRRVLEHAESWRPWRAYATMHLWART